MDKEDVVYIYNGILFSCKKKKKEFLPFEATWMECKGIMLYEISQTTANTMTSLTCGIFFFLAMPLGLWDLSSPTRDRTRAPCSGSAES